MLNQNQVLSHLRALENERMERTVSTTDTGKFCEAICAFANDLTQTRLNGFLFIGVDDHGKLTGLQATDKLLKDLAGIRSDGNILPQPVMSVYKYTFPEGDVVIVEVTPSFFPPVRYKGKIWIRIGARKAVANEAEERLLIEKRAVHGTTFDLRPCFEAQSDALKIDIFNGFYLPKAIDISTGDTRSTEQKMASLRFYDLINHCPTNAGVLLLGKRPEYYFFGAYIQYVKFEGKTVSSKIINEHKFTGDLISVLNSLDTFIQTGIEQKHPVFVSALREEIKRSYPHMAIRELLMNAVMHRDYESNAPVKFYEFEDRIEVVNPGGLYGNARPENFPHVNDYRNPVLAEAMKVLGYVNRFNRGIQSVQQELNENGNGRALFHFESITVFGVTVFNALHIYREKVGEKVGENISDNQLFILERMRNEPYISTPKIAAELGISTRKTEENIRKLRAKGLLERIGPAKGGYWKINDRKS